MAVYFISPVFEKPVGGVKILYKHVDILNQNGIEAYILHRKQGFRCSWFDNNTKIGYYQSPPIEWKNIHKLHYSEISLSNVPNKKITPDDIVVWPEVYGPYFDRVLKGIKKVIFNQNCYFSFDDFTVWDKTSKSQMYYHPDILACVVVSEDNKNYMEYVFPDLPIYRVHYSINPEIFKFSNKKKPVICYMTRKNIAEVNQVVSILKFRNQLAGFKFESIENKTEIQVGEIMGRSSIFLSFGYPEGFMLPSAEAMSCGCVAVGYHGNGAKEFLKPEFSFPIQIYDIMGFVKTVEGIVRDWSNNPLKYKTMGEKASNFVQKEYSVDGEKQDVVKIWGEILKRA